MTRFQPFDKPYPQTSGWGMRWGALHDGQDWACPVGTPIYSCHAGRVYTRPWDEGGYGWWVEIIGDDGYTTQYGHLSNSSVVPSGSWQPAGTNIGLSGNTGGSTGPHLHLRVKHTNQRQGFDPLPWLDGAPYARTPPPPALQDGDLAWTTEGDVYHWCRANGLGDAGAAGVMGNLQQESNFWWDAIECRGQVGHIPLEQALSYIVPNRCEGMGVLQWSFARRDNLIAYAQETSRPWYDSRMQLDFMLQEINATERYRNMWARISLATDPVVAARDFDDVFVRSGHKGSRFTYAQQHFDKIRAGRYRRLGGGGAVAVLTSSLVASI